MRWHLLATDKTYLQLKGFDEIPTDNREIWGKSLSIFTITAIIWCHIGKKLEYFHLNYSALLSDKKANEMPINRP